MADNDATSSDTQSVGQVRSGGLMSQPSTSDFLVLGDTPNMSSETCIRGTMAQYFANRTIATQVGGEEGSD